MVVEDLFPGAGDMRARRVLDRPAADDARRHADRRRDAAAAASSSTPATARWAGRWLPAPAGCIADLMTGRKPGDRPGRASASSAIAAGRRVRSGSRRLGAISHRLRTSSPAAGGASRSTPRMRHNYRSLRAAHGGRALAVLKGRRLIEEAWRARPAQRADPAAGRLRGRGRDELPRCARRRARGAARSERAVRLHRAGSRCARALVVVAHTIDSGMIERAGFAACTCG